MQTPNEDIPGIGHDSIPDDLFATFIGPNAPYYMRHFAVFRLLGGNFTTSWNWPAFLLPYAWLFYRKMYLYGLIALAVSYIFNFIGWLVAGIFVGLCGNYMYYAHTTKKLLGLKTTTPEADIRLVARIVGGTNLPVALVVGIVTLASLLLAAGALSFFFMGPLPVRWPL
ncbi:MAG: DUF2628 domain-containing protein [Desulfovibrionaceae bacterium]|nr:DUF2628 domain-containing protein [Desulfovibrionaceae bacterium]